MPTPVDTKLYQQVKREADAKFLAPTSAYKSAWIVAQYKRRGGEYEEDNAPRGLTRWFKEQWVDLERPKTVNGKIVGYEPCGRNVATTTGTYPLCRPSKRVNAQTPKTVQEIDHSTVKKVGDAKQKVKQSARVRFDGGSKVVR